MTKEKTLKDKLKEGVSSSIPIVLGYFPIAMAFGLLAKNAAVSFVDTALFSIMVYAGASQFMALDLIIIGVSTSSIILATFLLNLRHMMMSASLSREFKKINPKYLPLIAFGITDETFSVASFNKEKISLPFVLTLHILAYGSWGIGTMVGYLAGEIIPSSLQSSLGIGLYAMFAALLFPEIRKSNKILFLSIISAMVYAILFYSKIFTSGWDIILGILISSALGVMVFRKDEEGEVD